MTKDVELLIARQVRERVGVSRPALCWRLADGTFPQPVYVGDGESERTFGFELDLGDDLWRPEGRWRTASSTLGEIAYCVSNLRTPCAACHWRKTGDDTRGYRCAADPTTGEPTNLHHPWSQRFPVPAHRRRVEDWA